MATQEGAQSVPVTFTPGPWKVGGEWPQLVAVYDARCIYIAHANTGANSDWLNGNPLGRGVAQANAHLIAAAPELYEALETARKALDRNYVFNVSLETILAVIDAVLAKARGEREAVVEEACADQNLVVRNDNDCTLR